jgi:transketolase
VSELSTRDGFGRGLLAAAKKDERVVVVSADLQKSLRLSDFATAFPERFFEVGVAEQNMISISAGLALVGLVPFSCSFSCFSPTLTFGQIRQSVIESAANVKIVGSHGGVMTGADGVSHQALEDLALMTSLPGMVVVVPADADQAYQATKVLAGCSGPAYLRLTRPPTPSFGGSSFILGRARLMRSGEKVTIVSCGPILAQVLAAADLLASEGVQAEVIDVSTVLPLDSKTIIGSGRKTGRVVTVEDHSPRGGLGSLVAMALGSEKTAKFMVLGVEEYASSARDWQSLLAKCGLDGKNIARRVMMFINADR